MTLTHRAKFPKAQATESFSWRVGDAAPKLYGYNINSPALVTN